MGPPRNGTGWTPGIAQRKTGRFGRPQDRWCRIPRDDLDDPNSFLGYLGSDEFAMLRPITEWIKAEQQPFFLTVLCSVTHDPYEVPEWFGIPPKDPLDRYRQAIRGSLARRGKTDE